MFWTGRYELDWTTNDSISALGLTSALVATTLDLIQKIVAKHIIVAATQKWRFCAWEPPISSRRSRLPKNDLRHFRKGGCDLDHSTALCRMGL